MFRQGCSNKKADIGIGSALNQTHDDITWRIGAKSPSPQEHGLGASDNPFTAINLRQVSPNLTDG